MLNADNNHDTSSTEHDFHNVCRRLFKLPALHTHQPTYATWQKPITPPVSIHYPKPQKAAHSQISKPKRVTEQPTPAAATRPADQEPTRSGAETDPATAVGPSSSNLDFEDDVGEFEDAAASDYGTSDEAHYQPQGLKPSPVARALAGPTVHLLLEGYVSPCPFALYVLVMSSVFVACGRP